MIVKPSYCNSFQCIASRCRDNCCIGWEIDIDEETDRFYRNVTGDFKRRLEDGISRDGTPHFRLQGKKERCAFLNDDNLCDIFIHLGEEHLCGICREHPRFYEWYEEIPGLMDWTESGLGLCCEEAARLFVSETGPLRLTVEWESEAERKQWEKAAEQPQTEESSGGESSGDSGSTEGSTDDSGYDDSGYYDDGSYDESGYYDDGYYDDGSYDDGSYYE